MKKLLLGVLVVAMLAAIGWQAYRRINASGAGGPKDRSGLPVAVEARAIRKGLIRDVGVFTGSLVPKSQFVIAPKVSGWLRELLVNVGDAVERNQVIATLDDEEFTRQLEQARAELQVAKANAENCTSDLEVAQREYERAKTLREKQIASASALDESAGAFSASQSRLKVAQAQVAQRDAALKAAELRVSYTKVQAFWEGSDQTRVIGERFVDAGALLQVNQPIVSVLQNDPLVAVVYVIERDYPKVSIGQQAVVTTDAYPGRMFTGSVARIAPLLKESSRQARLEIEISNPQQQLRPGMFVRAQIEFSRHADATLVPLAALVRREDKTGLFIVDAVNRKARFVPVSTGITAGETVEILAPAVSGLAVTLGGHLLQDGSDILLSTGQTAEKSTPEANAPLPGPTVKQESGGPR